MGEFLGFRAWEVCGWGRSGLYCGSIGIMEKKWKLLFRVQGLKQMN